MFANFYNYLISFFDFGKSFSKRIKIRVTRKDSSVQSLPITTNQPIEFLLNDETTPNLKKSVIPFEYNTVKFQVKNYQGGGFPLDSEQGRAANAYIQIANSLNMVEKYTPMFKSWPGTSNLIVLPNAGKDFNAFYNRRSMQFFSGKDPVRNTQVHTSCSSDIITHELGHAILDSFRPDTWSVAALEVWSFHEAFADLNAILSILQHDEIIDRLIAQTNGNLRIHNIASSLAENMGITIFNLTNDRSRPRTYLRSAINDFKYVDPGTLPKTAPDDALAAECHSFGRVFLGAFYDIFEMIVQTSIEEGKTLKQSIIEARDILGQYVFKSIKNAPLTVNFYESMCRTMMWAAWNDRDAKYHDKIKAVFLNRNLIKEELRILSSAPKSNEEGVNKTGEVSVMKLSDHLLRAQGQDNNELYDVKVDVPNENAYFYDLRTGIAIDFVGSTEFERVSALEAALIYLHKAKQVSNGNHTCFEISNGKLQRTLFS